MPVELHMHLRCPLPSIHSAVSLIPQLEPQRRQQVAAVHRRATHRVAAGNLRATLDARHLATYRVCKLRPSGCCSTTCSVILLLAFVLKLACRWPINHFRRWRRSAGRSYSYSCLLCSNCNGRATSLRRVTRNTKPVAKFTALAHVAANTDRQLQSAIQPTVGGCQFCALHFAKLSCTLYGDANSAARVLRFTLLW